MKRVVFFVLLFSSYLFSAIGYIDLKGEYSESVGPSSDLDSPFWLIQKPRPRNLTIDPLPLTLEAPANSVGERTRIFHVYSLDKSFFEEVLYKAY